ncbi:hypothetical protein M413DRAFT_446688 [Hebeloma cylindrosporum]|uniref:Sodium/calcium exchanger membrane region domain-containing protein n=1 Tax=Hebeloma cylindrosporum TaxID=76867 RepID=A0A0C3C695_HEBCY|nr:hypothetical protein M413DRAFT_446688 [Hebeloma cylindrosporum h7]
MGSSMEGSTTLENNPSNDHSNQPVGSTSARQHTAARTRSSIPPINPSSATIVTAPAPRPKLWHNLRKRTREMLIPARPVGKPPGVLQSLKSILCASWLNMLLVCIPVSWALHWALPHSNASRDTVVFIFSFLAIIPLAKLLGFATEELSLRVGQTLAGLLNATLGNAVELIVAIIALVKCELRVVQASLVGSVLSNLLLVLGMCFFAGGLKYSEQGFGLSATQLNTTLLTISVIAVLLPAAFHFSVADQPLTDAQEAHDILAVSHGVAVILLFIYAGYLAFQLYTHTALYEDKGIHSIATTAYTSPKFNLHHRFKHRKDIESPRPDDILTSPLTQSPLPRVGTDASTTLPPSLMTQSSAPHGPVEQSILQAHVEFEEKEKKKEEEEEETPQLSLWMTIGLLIVVTVLVAITAEWLVDSIDGLTSSGHISKEFVGIILLPIVGNAAEHVTAVTVSVKDKLNLSLGVAVGSSIQIALFVIPFIVILGWILEKPLTLLFDPYESVAMFLSVLTVNYAIQDGKSNWLEGFILMCLYLILAVTFWFYPGTDPSGVLKTCT